MQWDRTNTIGLAKASCTSCHGCGLRLGRGGRPAACNCVYRAIFRACYARFRDCATAERFMSHVSLEFCRGRDQKQSYGRKNEEYIADFCLVSRRALAPHEYQIFRYHFLLGADWKLCCRHLGMDRGNFFHAVYRIEQKLGRVFRELEPYSLFPLNEYFATVIRKAVPGGGPAVSMRTAGDARQRDLISCLPRCALG